MVASRFYQVASSPSRANYFLHGIRLGFNVVIGKVDGLHFVPFNGMRAVLVKRQDSLPGGITL